MSSSWLKYLQEAKAEPFGLAIICNSASDADSAKQQLYSTRARAREDGDKSFDSLSISMSPHLDNILYIYESEAKNAEVTGTESEASDDQNLRG